MYDYTTKIYCIDLEITVQPIFQVKTTVYFIQELQVIQITSNLCQTLTIYSITQQVRLSWTLTNHKHIKNSAVHWSNIHMMSSLTTFHSFFLPQFVVYIVYEFQPTLYCFWLQVHSPSLFLGLIIIYFI